MNTNEKLKLALDALSKIGSPTTFYGDMPGIAHKAIAELSAPTQEQPEPNRAVFGMRTSLIIDEVYVPVDPNFFAPQATKKIVPKPKGHFDHCRNAAGDCICTACQLGGDITDCFRAKE